MKFLKLFESFITERKNYNLGIELANYLRTADKDSTVDDFFNAFNIPASGRSDFAFSAILKQAQRYIDMSDDAFQKEYNEYKDNLIEVEDYDTSDIECEYCASKGVVECEHCQGHGYEDCPSCQGDGDIECKSCKGYGLDENDNECSDCSGNGSYICEECDGSKMIECTDCHGSKEITCPHCGLD